VDARAHRVARTRPQDATGRGVDTVTMRKLGLTTLLILVTAACCELAARAVIDLRGYASRRDERRAFLQQLPAADEDAADDPSISAADRARSSSFSLHPYFGYTFAPSSAGADARGFHPGSPPGERRTRDELVVGVFGGSVAMQVADPRAGLAAALEPAARTAGRARATVRSYAIGGWRQPQHFNALVHFLDEIDVAILLDGFNEVIHLGDWQLAQHPAEYPWSAVWDTLARRPSASETVERAALVELHRRARRATTLADHPLVRRSTLAHLLWRVYRARYEDDVAQRRSKLAAASHERPPTSSPQTITARRDAYLTWLHELIAFSDVIARSRGKSFFHFVQPNQYDRGAKPLSLEERERFTRNTAWFDEVTPRYARLERMTLDLRSSGVDSTYLGDVFAQTSETVYVDDCCHLNERGVALLVAAIADRVVASDGLVPERS
jgi:hypothetical protein